MLYKFKFNVISILLLLILNSFFVNALGLTLPYHPVDGYGELGAPPGAESEVLFYLQNGADGDISVKASIKEGGNIVRISG